MVTLKEGQRVLVTGDVGYKTHHLRDAKGTIVKFMRDEEHNDRKHIPCVEFDREVDGHNCDGKAKVKHGWFLTLGDFGEMGLHKLKVVDKKGKVIGTYGEELKPLKSKASFKIGDKVYVNGKVDGLSFRNDKGTLSSIIDGSPTHCVDFDKYRPGLHTCNESVTSERGYYVNEYNLSKKPVKGIALKKLQELSGKKTVIPIVKPLSKDFCKALAEL